MLTLAKIDRSNLARQLYYEQELALSRAAYYTGEDGPSEAAKTSSYAEPAGVWLGAAAGELGLGEVRVELDELRAMWAGNDPSSGDRLQVRETTVSAFDLLYAAPKSVSVAHMMSDGDTREAIVAAHGEAVRESLGYLERHAALVRRREGGHIVAQHADGLLVSGFEQHWNRENEPHLHTHAVVANMAPGPDGRWSALHGGAVYRHLRSGGYVYQAKLRQELTERLGVQWGPVVNGQAELTAIPPRVSKEFSRRHAQIVENVEGALDRPGAGGARARGVAQRSTRRAKEHHNPAELVRDARALAEEHGFDRAALAGMLEQVTERATPSTGDLVALGTAMSGPNGLTAQANHFTRCEVIEALAAAHPAGASAEELERLADRYLASRSVVALDRDPDATLKGARYTSPELLAVEQEVLERARSGQGAGKAAASAEAVEGALAACPHMSAEQADMVRAFCDGGDRVMVGVGRAGTGKTFTAAVMADAYERSGIAVFGTAVAKRAARGLQAETGIPSRTVASLLGDYERWGAWPEEMRGGVLFIDEIGMLPTRQMSRLMDAAWGMGMDVRGIGDDAQLPEIQAGGTLRALKDELPTPELREVRRQRDPAVREGLEHLRHGESRQWLAGVEQRGNVTAVSNADALRDHAVERYLADVADHDFGQVLLMARTHEVRRDLNDRVREHRRAAGELGERELTVADRAFAEGDRVIALRNNSTLNVENGVQGTVTRVREELSLDVTLDDGRQGTLPSSYLQAGHVDHAYAQTVYKAQGATVEHAHFLGSEDVYREEGYTGLTRSREESHFYLLSSNEERTLPGLARDDERVERVLASMSDSHAREYATRLAERIQAAGQAPDDQLAEQAESFDRLLIAYRQEEDARELLSRREQELNADQARLNATEERMAQQGRRARRDRELTELRRVQAQAVERADELLEKAELDLAAHSDDRSELLDAAAARLEQRRRERGRIREVTEHALENPGPHVRELIGERSDALDVETWERAARRIEAYHQTYHPDRSELQMPDSRAQIEQRRDFETLKDAVTRSRGEDEWTVRLPSPTRELTRDLAPGLSPDLGPDLGP
ncbi:MAG: relaxase domain-containing protein [Actinomycetota bacterium]|nr:relaxase domain-containing protein [Actinomycetota bacterium]